MPALRTGSSPGDNRRGCRLDLSGRATINALMGPNSGKREPCPNLASPTLVSGLFLLQHLPALVHAGLEVEVVRTAQLARVLVLDIGGLLQRVGGAAHATARRRGFSAGNGHLSIL